MFIYYKRPINLYSRLYYTGIFNDVIFVKKEEEVFIRNVFINIVIYSERKNCSVHTVLLLCSISLRNVVYLYNWNSIIIIKRHDAVYD